MNHIAVIFALIAVAGTASAAPQPAHPGEAVYAQACAACHEGGIARAPHKMFL